MEELILSEKMSREDFDIFMNLTGLYAVGFSRFVVYTPAIMNLIDKIDKSDANILRITNNVQRIIQDQTEIVFLKNY
jgi:hypothetical protein